MKKHPPGTDLVVPQEFCPEAVVNWYIYSGGNNKENQKTQIKASDLRTKARSHLSAMGWTFPYAKKKDKDELRYKSPSGKLFYSLRTACKACMEGLGGGAGGGGVSNESIGSNADTCAATPPMDTVDQVPNEGRTCLFPEKITGFDGTGQESLTPSTALSVESVKTEEISHHTLKDDVVSGSVVTKELVSPKGRKPKLSKSLARAGEEVVELMILGGDSCSDNRKRKRHVVSETSKTGNKRVRMVVPNRNPRPKTILSSLIDNNVVSAGARVHYRGRKCSGQIFHEGIKCHCCSKLFFLTAFEAHAGSTNHRPAANILLDNGRSLLDCQKQLKTTKSVDQTTRINTEGGGGGGGRVDQYDDENDDVCAVCHYGGDLVLCDRCPSAYHAKCLGLQGPPPSGDWFCPPCRCGVCRFGGNFADDNGDLVCHQCERKYHTGCSARAFGSRESWFCSENCEGVCLGLEKILGKRIPVGENGLTWTLLKATRASQRSKLGEALFVMHECFEPAKDPLTNRDVVEDVIFGRESELKRLNFKGFHVVVLERNDDMISVATVRVFGSKLAEVPLVATWFLYRRMGMGGVLMRELEKQLGDLGVERLTLPSAKDVLPTWTSSFGFSQMTDEDKLELLDYNLLDFQDTVMCQKLLKKRTSVEKSRPLRRNLDGDFIQNGYNVTDEIGGSTSLVTEEQNVNDWIVDETLVDNAGAITWHTVYS